MPISTPIAVADRGAPDKPRRVPAHVRAACLMMIEQGADFVAASRAHGLKPDTMRRWLHRPEVISLIRRERTRFRASVCASNEYVLAKVRNESANAMAVVRATQVLQGIEDGEVAKPAAVSPGICINIIHSAPEPAAPIVDVTPVSTPSPAPAEPPSAIFKPFG